MFSPSSPDEVLAELGDEFLRRLAGAVAYARVDIADMRAWRPGWFPPMSVRCLANLIHDRIWAHFAAAVDGSSAVNLFESGPTREIQVGMNFRLRIKRHHDDDSISTYPTETALGFYLQEQVCIEGLELIKLAAGYRWDAEMREILAPVISYRDGKDNPVWAVELREPDAGMGPISWAPIVTPSLPLVDVGGAATKSETGTEDQ
jgi:hypothetical protein